MLLSNKNGVQMLSSSYKESVTMDVTFVENQYYFSKTYLHGENDLTEEEFQK